MFSLDISILLFKANVDMEDVPDMSIRKPVSTHPKSRPMGRKPTVLISLSDTRVYPVATPDATGDLMMTRVFIQSYQFPENASSAAETSVTAVSKSKLHPPSQTWSLRPRNDRALHFKDFRMSNLPILLKGGGTTPLKSNQLNKDQNEDMELPKHQ